MATDQASSAPDIGEPPSSERPATVGELFARLSEQISSLVQGEIELTKTKAAAFLKKVGAGGALLAVAAVLALYMLGWLFHTVEVALAVALPEWAASLIVLALLLVLVALLAFVGVKLIQKGQEHTPNPQEGIRQDVDAFKKGLGK